jgi:hypothetical protein
VVWGYQIRGIPTPKGEAPLFILAADPEIMIRILPLSGLFLNPPIKFNLFLSPFDKIT